MVPAIAPATALAATLLLLSCGAPPPDAPGAPPASGSGSPQAEATAPPSEPVMPSAPDPAAPGDSVRVPFWSLAEGATSQLRGERSEIFLRDEASLAAWLVGNHHPEPARYPDLEREIVLAVEGADAPNGCHAVRVSAMALDRGVLQVAVTAHGPGPGAICSQAMNRPYHAVVLPRETAFTDAEFSWSAVAGEPSR